MSAEHQIIGMPIDRTDGVLKVTGAARYAGDFTLAGLCHAVMVQSRIASGRIAQLDVTRAEHAEGVLFVMTHLNAPSLPQSGRGAINPPAGRTLSLLQDDAIHYHGEPIAVVVADTLEHAVSAASLVHATYSSDLPALDFDQAKKAAYTPAKAGREDTDKSWGNPETGLAEAQVRIDAVYRTPMQTHNPMEPHATLAHWDGPTLTLYDATQYISGVRQVVAKTFAIDPKSVRVLSPFVGGGFGCKGSTWSHVVLAAMASRRVGRPVKLVLERPQMFGPVGGRPQTEQHVVLGARSDGTLTVVRHDVLCHTSVMEDFVEPSALVTRMLYTTPNGSTTHRLVRLNTGVTTFQRAPGEATGSFALETAMDELANALRMDPLALRLRNYADTEPASGKPFSSKQLRACYEDAASRFGWSRRSAAPGSMRDGNTLVGWGMATATYPANRMTASASASMMPDGTVVVRSGSQDLGTGTYTIMTQVAAETLGLPLSRVRVELGDTDFPEAPVSGGSMTAASVAPAVLEACLSLRDALIETAVQDPLSPVHGSDPKELVLEDGMLGSKAQPSRREPIAAVVSRRGTSIEVQSQSKPGDEKSRYSLHSFGAIFVEVRVDRDVGEIRVPRVVATYDVGRVLNAKTARSQLHGGIVWGISLALFEHSLLDPTVGRFVNANLAEYHVPSNADIGAIDIRFVDVPDLKFNPLGVRGVGEIGITGVAGAICNAVFHATGQRIRRMPITLSDLVVPARYAAT